MVSAPFPNSAAYIPLLGYAGLTSFEVRMKQSSRGQSSIPAVTATRRRLPSWRLSPLPKSPRLPIPILQMLRPLQTRPRPQP